VAGDSIPNQVLLVVGFTYGAFLLTDCITEQVEVRSGNMLMTFVTSVTAVV
jgi:hypothetical protein